MTAEHLLEPVEALVDAFQLSLDSHLGIVLVGGMRQVPLLVGPRDEGRRNRCRGGGKVAA
jgi:hypothetical protein